MLFVFSHLRSMCLEHVDDVLRAVEEIAGEGIPELLNASKDESSASWPTLNRWVLISISPFCSLIIEQKGRLVIYRSSLGYSWIDPCAPAIQYLAASKQPHNYL